MSGQGRTRSREGEEYDQLDSNIIPQPQRVEEGIDSGIGQANTSAGAVAIPHRPSTSGSDQGVEESQGAVATGGMKKRRSLKHAIRKKIINQIVKPRSDSQLSPDRVAADPQNILEGESSMEDPAELEERLREKMKEKLGAELREEMEEKLRAELRDEMEENVRAELREEMEEILKTELREEMEGKLRVELREEMKEEKANWTKTAEAKWKDEAKRELQKLREDLAGKFEEERKSTAIQAQSELEHVNQKNSTILQLKARELQDKEAAIKSLQEEVEKLKHFEGSSADLTEKNLELKKEVREMERLQLEKIQDLEKLLEQQHVSLSQQKEEIDQQAKRHKAELDTKDRHHQDDLQQAKEELKLIQQLKENGEVQLADMTKKMKELEVEREKVKGQLEDAEKLRGEIEKECRDLQIQKGKLLKRNEVEEQGQAENEGGMKHENEMRSLQYELELAQSELKQERERGCAKLRQLEDKLRAVEEEAVQTGRVTLLEPSGAPEAKDSTIAQYNGQEQMKPGDSAQPLLDIPSNVHQFCLQLSELVDPEGQSLQAPSLPLSTEALKAIGVTPNVKSRGYVVAVFQAYAKAQSILLDYSRVGEYKGHEGLMAGDDKSPRTSLGEEKSPYSSFGEAKLVGAEDNKSPYSSLGEVKMVVAEDNMTDSDKLELQDMLKQSQEELERLWNHNKLLHERLKVLEGQHHMYESSELEEEGEIGDISKSQCKVSELTNCLRAYEEHLCYLPKPSDQEHIVETEPVKLQRLKKKYLSLHAEKLQIQSEKMKLLGELEERDVQLKELQEKLTYGSPHIERSLSLGALESPEDPEVYRLRSVVDDRDKKLNNLNIQLKTFQEVAASNVDLQRQLGQLQMKLKATEAEVEQLKTDSELAQVNKLLSEEVSSVRKRLKTLECEREEAEKDAERKMTAERDSIQELEGEVAQLKLALRFWESKYPQDGEDPDTTDEELAHQVEVTDLQNKIKRKNSAIQTLSDCRGTLESRMARLREERDRYAEQNSELLAIKANLMGELDRYSEFRKEHAVQLKMKLAEAEALKIEKEAMKKEAEDLRDEIEARKFEVDLVTQDFEEEHRERENMASRYSEEFGKWRVREQKLESRLREVGVNHQEDIKQMDNKLKLLTHQFEQRELQLTAKLEQTGKLQQELDVQCDHLRMELDGVRMEWKEEFELRQEQEKEHQEIVQGLEQQMDEESDRLSHAEGQLKSMEEQLQHLRGEKQHVEEHLITQKLKHEKFLGSMKHGFDKKLREISNEKDALASKLGALEQQRKHDYAEWTADRRDLEEAIADTARLSDEVMTLEQQLKHHKAQADSFKAKLREKMRHFEQLSKEREEEHREEVEIIRAQCESEKVDQELLMIPLKRELDRLRLQTFGDGQHSDTFRRMEAEGREARNELEILRGKYDEVVDGLMEARDLLIKHSIPLPNTPLPKRGDQPIIIGQPIVDETQVSAQPYQDMDSFVCPYGESPPQLLPPSGDPRNVGAEGFHRLGDRNTRKHAFSTTQPRASDRPPLDNYGNDPYGADQQNLVSQRMLNKAGYNKPGGYPEKPVSPSLATPEHFQPPVLRAPREGGVIQGRAPYSQQGGGAIRGHAYDQRSQPPVSEVPSSQPYQQPRYTPPQLHLPQGQQAPQPQHVPYGHGQPQHAPHGHGHGHASQPQRAPPSRGDPPQGKPYPPSSAQGKHPPNPSAPQENYLVKSIDAEIAAAAAGVRQEVTLESVVPGGEAWPLDSNLICPMCKKQYRIGQIQYYKKHVDKCEGV